MNGYLVRPTGLTKIMVHYHIGVNRAVKRASKRLYAITDIFLHMTGNKVVTLRDCTRIFIQGSLFYYYWIIAWNYLRLCLKRGSWYCVKRLFLINFQLFGSSFIIPVSKKIKLRSTSFSLEIVYPNFFPTKYAYIVCFFT